MFGWKHFQDKMIYLHVFDCDLEKWYEKHVLPFDSTQKNNWYFIKKNGNLYIYKIKSKPKIKTPDDNNGNSWNLKMKNTFRGISNY